MKPRTRLLPLFLVLCLARFAVAEPQTGGSLSKLDKSFLFAYGSWEKKVVIENGHVLLRGPGVTPRGGAGINENLDLAAQTDFSPALRIKTGAANTMKNLRLTLLDTSGQSGEWIFALPQPGANFTLVLPHDAAPLALPNKLGDKKQPLDLSKIMQWQLGGDWSGDGAVDVEVESMLLAAPDDAIRTQRKVLAQRIESEAEAKKRAQEALKNQLKPGSPTSPSVEHVSLVAPDTISIEIQAGRVIPATLTKYEAQAGDEKVEKKNDKGEIESVTLSRGGKELGLLVGAKRDWLTANEGYEGDALLDFVADDVANYSVSSGGDFGTQKPTAVYRKSKPNDWAQGPGQLAVRHTIYLKMPKPLTPGQNYIISLGALNTKQSSVQLMLDPAKVRSEALHVNQIGYRPDDTVKRAFVSCWMGTGGALTLPDALNFSLVDDATGKIVFSGKGEKHFPAAKLELMGRDDNFNKTDVARLDFSAFRTPGKYRVMLEGVGCSYPFEIGADVWKRAFLVQMKGLYNQRSGMELGPPYTDFRKPRDMNPLDGYKVTKTKYRAVEAGGEAWAKIPAGDTGEAADGWGGYHDAGDWNPRRVSHMKVTMAQLEMLELFPQFFAPLKLNIPEIKGVPDILSEAIWEFECFHRLQQADGGVGFGLESKADPLNGEVSWLNSFPSYALASDYAASWFYAAVGARLSHNLAPFDAKRAAIYRESAIRAFDWAETDWARDKAANLTQKRDNWGAIDDRNLAALELYRLTREPKYHELFLQDSVLKDENPELFAWGKHVQRDHAFLYARLPDGLGDATMKKKAVAALETMANRALTYAGNNAFNLTTPDKGKPQAFGFYGTPDATDLTRAHFLTGNAKYLSGAIQATQFQSGANPSNLVYITGLGTNPIKHPLHLDSRRTGQAAPIGLVPYGNVDFAKWNDGGITWPITWFISKVSVPDAYSWPTHEAYWDLGTWPMLEEFTVDNWAPNVQIWGYLAARK